MPSHEQVREGCQHIHLAAVIEHSAQAGLLKAELPLDHAEWMLTFGADVSLGGLDQIIQPPFRCIG
jgi:hypothetical protein